MKGWKLKGKLELFKSNWSSASSLSWAPPIVTHHLPFGARQRTVRNPNPHHLSLHGLMVNPTFLIKRSACWCLYCSFMSQVSPGCATLLQNTPQRRPIPPLFWVWLSSRVCIWISPAPQPPIQTLQAFPPSFSPCLLSFLPPAQTFSQTQRVNGKNDRILSWL